MSKNVEPYISGKIKKVYQSLYCPNDYYVGTVYIEKIIYNGRVTVVFWSDGTKTVSKCHPHDIYSKEAGLSMCILKKLIGSTELRNIYNDWILSSDGTIKLSDVRRKLRNTQK